MSVTTHLGSENARSRHTNTNHNQASERMDPLRYLAGSVRICLIIKEYGGPAVHLMACDAGYHACVGHALGGLLVYQAGVFPKVGGY